MATNKFKSVMVNPSYELEFPPPQEFVKVNNIATFGSNVDGELHELKLYGPDLSEEDGGQALANYSCNTIELHSVGFPQISMHMGPNLRSDAECAITTSGLGLSLPDYTYVGNVYLHENRISYGEDGDTQIILSDEQINVGSSNTKVVLPANTTIGGNTPATFGDNVSGTLKDLTIGYGGGIYGRGESLWIQPVSYSLSKIQLNLEDVYITSRTFEHTFADYTIFNSSPKDISFNTIYAGDSGQYKISFKNSDYNIIELLSDFDSTSGIPVSSNINIKSNAVNINANGGVVISHNFAKQSADADATFNALELTNANDAGLIVSLSGGYNGTPETKLKGKSGRFIIEGAILENCTYETNILGNLAISGNKILGSSNTDVQYAYVDIYDADNPYNSEIALNVYDNGIRIANTNTELGAIGGYEIKMTAPKVSISDTFEIPVYTTDDAGNYTKVNNERKTVRCVKQVLSDGTATYTLELA